MRGRVYVGYKNHKKKKTKRLRKQGPQSVLMEVDSFDQFTGEKINSRFVRVRLDITELIADIKAILAE
jgi:hypothetical protein